MSMQVLKGTGKLYDADGKQVIATVNYQIREKPPTEYTLGEWRGSFDLDCYIDIHPEYIIELEDGRRGTCFIEVNITAVAGLTIYRYSFQGSGSLI